MSAFNLPGRKKNEPAPVPAPMSRLDHRRDELRTKFSELQWDLGGAAYEMAARDYFRLDVLASMAAKLQVVDAELAEIERMARLERAGAAGSCAGCGSLYARGAVYCWRCGRNLREGRGTVVGPAITAPVVPAGSNGTPEPIIDPVVDPAPAPSPEPPEVIDQEPETGVEAMPSPAPETEPDIDDDYESGRPGLRPGYRPTPRSFQV